MCVIKKVHKYTKALHYAIHRTYDIELCLPYKALRSIHRVQFDIQSAFVPQIGLGSYYIPGQEVDRGGERGGGNIIHRGLSHYNTHSYLTFGFHPEMQKATSTASALVLFFSPSCANFCAVYTPNLLNLSIQRRISSV